MQKYGASRIDQVMLTESWYRENMPAYKAWIEDKSLTLPKDADLMEDHRFIRVVKGVAKIPEGRTRDFEKLQRHGDSAIAGAMLCYAARQAKEGMGLWDYYQQQHEQAKREREAA